MSDATITIVVTAVSGVVASLGAAVITALGMYINYKLKMMELQSKLVNERSEKESYKNIASDSLAIVETVANEKLHREGKKLITPIAPVVPEHESPVTAEQQAAADLQTKRAALVAATLALGLEPREASDPETDEQRAERLKAEGKSSAGDTSAVLAGKLSASVAKDLKADIAEVKQTVAEIPVKVADEIEDRKEGKS